MNSFEDLMKKNVNSVRANSTGALVEGKILKEINIKGQDYFLIDAGQKYEGIATANDVKNLDLTQNHSFLVVGEKEGYFLLSHEKAKKDLALSKLKKAQENREEVSVKIISKVNDGYKVLVYDELSALLKTPQIFELDVVVSAHIIKIYNHGNIVMSDTPNTKQGRFSEGVVINGTVLSFNDYLVFVDVENSDIEGVVHFQDLSWNKVNFPGEVISQGQQLQFKVLKAQNKVLYLGLKQMEENPWNFVKEKFSNLTKIYNGKIKNITESELVIDMGEGVIGTVHIAESSWGFKRGTSLSNDFTIGQSIDYKILEVDNQRKRLKLTIKQLTGNPFFQYIEKYNAGDEVEGTILHDSSTYGSFIFVELIPGVDGMLHQSEIDWNFEDGVNKFNNLERGQKVSVKIINIDKEKMRISISIKRLKKDYFDEISSQLVMGNVYSVEIKSINSEGLNVSLVDFPECTGFIKKHEISNNKNVRIFNFSAGNIEKAKLISINNFKRFVNLSIKALQSDENKNAIKNNKNKITGTSFGDFL